MFLSLTIGYNLRETPGLKTHLAPAGILGGWWSVGAGLPNLFEIIDLLPLLTHHQSAWCPLAFLLKKKKNKKPKTSDPDLRQLVARSQVLLRTRRTQPQP